jgi:hypothetical protein
MDRMNICSGMCPRPKSQGFQESRTLIRALRSPVLIGALFAGCFSGLPLRGQMIDPSLDRDDEPFSYFSQPTDVIGVMDARAGTLISPEGYLYTGFGELMFFMGDPLVPTHQRVKTLLRDYLPVVEYQGKAGGIRCRFTMFAATLDGRPEGTLVNFVRVKIRNENTYSAVAHFATGVRYQNDVNTPGYGGSGKPPVGDNRFLRPATAKRVGQYAQLGELFNPDWVYGFQDNGFLRDGKVLYTFPGSPEPGRHLTTKEDYNGSSDLTPRRLIIPPTTPVGIVQYSLPLAAGAETTLVFKMPYVPLDPKSPEFTQFTSADFDDYLNKTVDFWENLLARGIDISVPEEKVNNVFKANLIYDLIARDKIGDQYVQTVNKFHYHAFWLRDSSYIVRMYDVSGYHDFARQVLDFFAGWQQPDGNFVSQGGQFDGWGQTLWAYGQHYRITHDRAFAEKVYPAVRNALQWLKQARQTNPLHLMPITAPGDNEGINGHITGHNFWALAGLKNAIALADGLGQEQDAAAWRREYADFRSALLAALEKATANTNGYIPPGLDGEHGQDWGNMLSVYPEQILAPFDPKVTATLQATRAKYQEGIMTYGDEHFLHHYLTMKNTETEVIRGDQQMAVEELYALLLHTSSTHAGFEFAILPWGTRDFGLNLSPHGWFSAKFRTLVRNMMVREEGGELHLLSVISPEWIKPGAVIAVRRAPTEFGSVSFELQVPADGQATLHLDNLLTRAPERTILHLPWFLHGIAAAVDGNKIPISDGTLVLPPGTKEVRLQWANDAATPQLSYARAVEDYKAEYRRRYEEFLRIGKP